MKKKLNNVRIFLVLLIILTLSIGCISNDVDITYADSKEEVKEEVKEESVEESASDESLKEGTNYIELIKSGAYDSELPTVAIELEDGGMMIFELYPNYAPETVANFLSLVDSGFYDGLKFHRIIKGFMAQSGDPLGNGTGGSGVTITGEFSKNGFEQNTLLHVKGVLSMARSADPNSASSQFFLMDGDAPHLDGSYAGFGMLIEGEDVLDIITATEVEMSPQGEMSAPKTDVIIKSMTIR